MSDEEHGFSEGPDVGFVNGSIRLEEIPTVYYPGQTINGSVIFDLRRPLSFTALNIQFLGIAKVFWTEMETVGDEDSEIEREVKYQGIEEYFNYTETLAGGFGVSQLPRTYQNFPFKFQIPFIAPSSFEGEKGSVSYSITAIMIYPDMSNEEIIKEFTVVAPFDLNKGNPRIKEPIEMEFDELYSCCFSSEPLNVRIKLPLSGFCPGQVIPVAVEVNNESSVEITKIVFSIIKRELYRSQQPPSDFILPERELIAVKSGAILANCKSEFTCDVPIPEMIVPNLENCGIIDIGYFFRVTVKLSGFNDALQDDAEICLGLVPVKESLIGEYVHPMAECLPRGPIPINDGLSEVMPPPPIGFTGPNARSQQKIPGNSTLSNLPPPYPCTAPYPTVNPFPALDGSNSSQQNISECAFSDPPPPYPGLPSETKDPEAKPNPYNIGFKIHTPYPSNVTPGASNDTPETNATGTVNMPLPPNEFAPSAPPPEE